MWAANRFLDTSLQLHLRRHHWTWLYLFVFSHQKYVFPVRVLLWKTNLSTYRNGWVSSCQFYGLRYWSINTMVHGIIPRCRDFTIWWWTFFQCWFTTTSQPCERIKIILTECKVNVILSNYKLQGKSPLPPHWSLINWLQVWCKLSNSSSLL